MEILSDAVSTSHGFFMSITIDHVPFLFHTGEKDSSRFLYFVPLVPAVDYGKSFESLNKDFFFTILATAVCIGETERENKR